MVNCVWKIWSKRGSGQSCSWAAPWGTSEIKKWLWKKIRLTQINIHFAYLLMQDNLKFLFYFTMHNIPQCIVLAT